MWVDDKVIYRYAGVIMWKGHVPYIDLFDHKPPLIYFLNYAGLLFGSWGLWIIDTLLVAGASLMFYERCREKQVTLPFLPPLFFNLLLRNYLVCGGIGMTREFTATFLLLAFCILLKRPRYTFFWLGLLTTAAFLTQQDQALPFLPFLAYAFLVPLLTIRRFLSALGQTAIGFLAIAGPILLYLALHHAIPAFWHDAFQFNFEWYADKATLGQKFRAIHDALKQTDLIMPLLICIALAGTPFLLRTKEKLLLAACLLATALAFGPQLFSARIVLNTSWFYYYYLPLSATLPILLFAAWTSAYHPFLRSKLSQAVLGFLLCAPLFYNALQHLTHLKRNDAVITDTPEYQFISHQQLSDYQLYAFASSDWVYAYNKFHILSPSPWVYHHFWNWFPHWDADHHMLESIGNDLLVHRTRYVIDHSTPPTFWDPTAYQWWQNFLQQHYQKVPLPKRSLYYILWELKPSVTSKTITPAPRQ